VELGAAVRRALEAVGRDIDGEGEVSRRTYELQAAVQRGNSGGPFALPGGRVAGMVFGASVTDENVSYALTSPRLIPLVERAASAGPVGTGTCAA
jgi:S1-C subfamily serine protease